MIVKSGIAPTAIADFSRGYMPNFETGLNAEKVYCSPLTRAEYWYAKIARNKARDLTVRRQLRAVGWKAMTIWECQLRQPDLVRDRIRTFLDPI
jgi:G:T-mismatch repair DNA endonuclease (very short patch repair protein)